ncbi:hypothetical protein J2W40_000074 [Sphingobium xenophagum]|uniref:Uncharacterized protein n=1 Tax=Sphingobium xenophagum TaxID=121428 RepID=A0ABU1WVE5_SPHXE|nr:hypothetical protein [Sphingobium xenophagum]MDR7153280.1 hypothetical protein [Sphingobium xenophagum]
MQPMIDFARQFDPSSRFSKENRLSSFLKTSSAVMDPAWKPVVSGSSAGPAMRVGPVTAEKEPVAAKLFSATASAKIWTSKVAMHLDRAVRDRIFRQLDILHDADEWIDDGYPVLLESYKTFIRALVHHHIHTRPSLSLMPSGHILAMWKDGQDKLSVEFMPYDKTRWMVQVKLDDVERAAGLSSLERLREVLQPYGADRWFNGS